MTKARFRNAEKKVVRDMKRLVRKKPEATKPSLSFKRDWAYGNAGLENATITRQQVNDVIKD